MGKQKNAKSTARAKEDKDKSVTFKKRRKEPKVPTESGPAPTGLASPWHTECILHRPWDAFLATGRFRLYSHACNVNMYDYHTLQDCESLVLEGSNEISDFTCNWCKRTTRCKANMLWCHSCFEPDTPFTPRALPNEEEHVFICKCCFEQHIAKSEKAKQLFDECDHCQVTYGKTFGKEAHKNPYFKPLKEKYKQDEIRELTELGILPKKV